MFRLHELVDRLGGELHGDGEVAVPRLRPSPSQRASVAVPYFTSGRIDVTLNDGAQQTLAVPGSDALPVLTPLSLAALALGAALSIAGPVVRYVFGALGLAIAALIGVGAAQIVFATA